MIVALHRMVRAAMMQNFSIYYEPSAFSLKDKLMGRQSAGLGFMQALANARLPELGCYASAQGAKDCARLLTELGSPRTGVRHIPKDQPELLAHSGLLYRADPVLGGHAWNRLTRSSPRAYSLCGITHTISSYGPMTAFAEYLTAPIETWDALICTSRGARDAVRRVLESQSRHLAERTGATRFTLPQLPIIPLGVHTDQFQTSLSVRQEARNRLGLLDDEVAVLFAGRLILHGKAHPLPMYLALEQASQNRKVVLIQAGRAPNESMLKIFSDEPAKFCPSVRLIMVDGSDFDLYHKAWAAADVFTSLSDNVQETFGLTPIEAMSAGLPVVVSDWDGYKDTVRDGIDGFRVPTLTLPEGLGGDLADALDAGVIDYDVYSGLTSQLVAVDINATAIAYRRLIDDPELRRRMGAAGARRARELFDWNIIFRRYIALWEELAERRRSDPQLTPPLTRRRRPDRADPFSMFASYPTHIVGHDIFFKRDHNVTIDEALARRVLSSTNFASPIIPSTDLTRALMEITDRDWISYHDVRKSLPSIQEGTLAMAVVWLSKFGALTFQRRP